MGMFVLNEEQKQIIELSCKMQMGEILKIQAPAGSGKTFILLQIAKHNPKSSFLYLAFNRAIVTEVSAKVPANVMVQTTHSLAYQHVVKRFYRGMQPRQEYKVFEIGEILRKRDYFYLRTVKDILEDFLNSAEEVIDISTSEAAKDAFMLYQMMKKGTIALTHSFYLKEYQLLDEKEKGLKRYDYLLLDEAQDTNAVTLDIFLKTPHKKILVGDEHQSIYSFRGAFNAMQNVPCTYEQQLTYCFRTPQRYLDKAIFFLNTFKGAKAVITEASNMQDRYSNTEAIITRTNAKIVEIIAESKESMIKPFKNPEEIFAMILSLKKLNDHEKDQIHYPHLLYLKKFADLEEVQEYAEATRDTELKYSIHVLRKYKEDILHIYNRAKKLFMGKGHILLLNTHTAKGLEFDRVRIADDFCNLDEYYQNLIQMQKATPKDIQLFYEEVNLYYVAITRTKKELVDDSINHIFYKNFYKNNQLNEVKE